MRWIYFVWVLFFIGCKGDESEHIHEYLHYDVVIVGAGIGGISAAYALKDSGLKIALIEKQSTIGGTQLNAWVNCNATSGDVPYIKEITLDMIASGTAKYVNSEYKDFTSSELSSIIYDDTLLKQRFMGNGRREACVVYDIEALRTRYMSDLTGNIDILTNHLLLYAKISDNTDNKVDRIVVLDLNSNLRKQIFADQFIDCTADDVLVRSVCQEDGIDFFLGSDAKNRFEKSHGFREPNAGNINNSSALNYPTLVYSIETGSENLSHVIEDYPAYASLYSSPNGNKIWVNSVSALGVSGISAVNNIKNAENILSHRVLQHWKQIKLGEYSRFDEWNLSIRKYVGHAPMLGVRETYRLNCERMLNENDLYVRISSTNITNGANMDKKIAMGCHLVDIHSDGNFDASIINANLQPYGVPYGCLIPKKLKNVLVASRGAGFTHIAAASFRLNKNIAQLGYAAGNAVLILRENGLNDFREVDVEKLQSPNYTNFKQIVKIIETYF